MLWCVIGPVLTRASSWSGKECCLPHDGYSNPPSPPKGSSCPSSWQWHNEKNCCIPTSPPSTSTPSCSSGWGWDSNKNCCQPHSPTTTAHTTAHTTTVHTTSVHCSYQHPLDAQPCPQSLLCPGRNPSPVLAEPLRAAHGAARQPIRNGGPTCFLL